MTKPGSHLVPGIALIILLGLSATTYAGSAVLTWSANTDSSTTGYKVYYGTGSRSYGTPIDVGTQITYTFTSLNPGTYYFAVTAYNSSGTQSGYSNEVAKLITAGTPASHCDINADGSVNSMDLQIVINAILAGTNLVNADLNGDGQVNSLDLQILGNVILGLGSCP